MFGSLIHYAFDALLLSVALAGIKRSTGLTLAVSRIQGKDIRQLVGIYLEMGEWTMDFMIVALGRNRWFERRRD
ncbi:DUF1748-domain-containing protein [Atractiella rhizophila]|nr:DUF1748-domain-containing protein [Atractiella rhizophila]